MAHRAPRGSRRRTGWAELPGQRAGLGRKEREVTLLLPRRPHWQGVWGEQEATAARLPSTARPQRPEEGRRRGITGPETLPKPRTHSHICTPRRAHAYTHTRHTACAKPQGPGSEEAGGQEVIETGELKIKRSSRLGAESPARPQSSGPCPRHRAGRTGAPKAWGGGWRGPPGHQP